MAQGTPSIDRLKEEIAGAEYRQAADTFCRLIVEAEQPLRTVVHSAVSAAAPFVQVPSHLMKNPDGEMRGVNYDHTILGWRGALKLMPHLSDQRSLLPTVQAIWYAPQGLNIWEQIICEFPGHYARDAQKCNLKYPGEDPEVDRFDGPAWTPPKIHFEDHEPIREGSVDDRFARLLDAIAEGDRVQSYGLFLGLAEDPANRERLKERILFAGIIDLQDTLINRGGYQNIGHKALRARALVDIADYFGWNNAHEIIYTVVPDLGCSPRLYGLWTEINNVVKIELPNAAQIPKRSDAPLTERELDQLTHTLLWGGPYEVNAIILRLLRRGAGLLDVTDGVAIGYQRYLTDVLEHPAAFNHPMHSFDYLNVVNHWLRTYENPHQVKAVFMAARFINDAFRANAMFPRDPKVELAPRSEYRPYADEIAVDRLLPVLQEAVLAQDAPRAGALVDSYLERTGARKDLLETITYAACHWQNDPHVMRNCISSIEEWHSNRTSRRDDIIRGFVKHQSRYIKRAKSHDCLELYSRHFFK
ncbi:MAG: hypothetical protein M3O34_18645 [Chloroflexota bacterium]|nr:hypothetical protein [Chloroflexota bacterium]